MHLKPEVIAGFLVFASFSFAAQVPNNPRCDPIPAGAYDREAHFVFWIDKLINSELLSRLRYLLKAISCEIPTSNKIMSLVISYNAEHQVFGSPVTSDKIPNELYRDVENSEVTNSTACSRFLRALAGVPAPFLKHKNVQFIVPIFDDDKEPQCFLRAFQNQYKDFEKNENFYFNGILINSLLPSQSNQSIRVVIPDLVRAINLSRISLAASDVINEVHESAHLVQSYGSIVHDWEEITTTKSLLSTTSIATFPTIPRRISKIKTETLLKRETGPDDIQFFDEITEEDPVLKPRAIFADSNSTNTSTASSSTPLTSMKAASSFNTFLAVSTNLSTSSNNSSSSSTTPSIQPSTTVNNFTEAQTTSTTGNVSTTTGISETDAVPADLPPTTTVQEYDAVVAEDSGRLAMMKGVKKTTNEQKNRTSTISGLAGSDENDTFNRTIDVEMFIYILLPLLIIWLFCIILCLLWMYYCAKEKKKKLESQSELLALLEKCPSGDEPSPSKLTSSKECDEVDDEWKKIKPPASTISSNPSNSELENVKQPPLNAQYAPVEVSEFEEKNDDFMENRPRHGGYVPRKKTADLRFD